MTAQEKCVEAYSRLKKLKLVADEVCIPWQTVYVYLRNAGVAVTGDKSRYGSDTDKLAAKAEADFQRLVPSAENQNKVQFQAKVDFIVSGYSVDVKASRPHRSNKRSDCTRWAFAVKKQESLADFFVCFAYSDVQTRIFLIPGELIRQYQTVSVSEKGHSKWLDYEISANELSEFFSQIHFMRRTA